MLALESEFDFEFPDRMLTRSLFSSIASIRDAITQLAYAARMDVQSASDRHSLSASEA
jgi:hypothetical protein